jgi:hypothetical protein
MKDRREMLRKNMFVYIKTDDVRQLFKFSFYSSLKTGKGSNEKKISELKMCSKKKLENN